jgi:hypothetical protein
MVQPSKHPAIMTGPAMRSGTVPQQPGRSAPIVGYLTGPVQGDADAIEAAIEAAWQLQRSAD